MSALHGHEPSDPCHTACFSVHAPVDPSVMPRVAEVFARLGLVPSVWYSSVVGTHGEELQIDIQAGGLDRPSAARVAAALRQLVCVECVLTSEKEVRELRPALSA